MGLGGISRNMRGTAKAARMAQATSSEMVTSIEHSSLERAPDVKAVGRLCFRQHATGRVRSHRSMSTIILPAPGHEPLASKLAKHLGAALGAVDFRRFPDGEAYVRVATPMGGEPVM